MDIRICTTTEELARYSIWVQTHPQGSLWQSLEWKQYQETLGREVRVYVVEEEEDIVTSALVVIDRTIGGCSTWDMPRGPLGDIVQALLGTIIRDTREDHCLALSLSPPSPLDAAKSFRLEASTRHEQPEATRIIDLTKPEEEILAQMHPKGRYNIKVAQKNGVQVEQSDDVEAFYSLLQQTAGRDGFQVLPLRTYKAFLECLPGSFLLLAFETSHKPIAGLLGVVWPPAPHPDPLPRGEGMTGIYYYGASDYAYRPLMAPYALQWEAMRLCKAKGCTTYDLLGIAPRILLSHGPSPCPLPRGEGECATPQNHPWAGISAFKEKFGGTVVTYPHEQQIVLRPLLWKILQWKRRFRRSGQISGLKRRSFHS